MSDPIAEPEWVEVEDGTYRARIPGGYLYRMTCKGAAASMTFVCCGTR